MARAAQHRRRRRHQHMQQHRQHGAAPPRLGAAGSREGGAARESARRRRRRLGGARVAQAGAEAQRRRWERDEPDPSVRGGDGRQQPAAAAAGQTRQPQRLQRVPQRSARPQHTTASQDEAATAETGWTPREWRRLGRRQARGTRKQEASRNGPLRRDGAEGQQQRQARREWKWTTEDAQTRELNCAGAQEAGLAAWRSAEQYQERRAHVRSKKCTELM